MFSGSKNDLTVVIVSSDLGPVAPASPGARQADVVASSRLLGDQHLLGNLVDDCLLLLDRHPSVLSLICSPV